MDYNKANFSIESVKEEVVDKSLVVASSLGGIVFVITFTLRLVFVGFTYSLVFEILTLSVLLAITFFRKKISLPHKVYIILSLIFLLALTDAVIYGVFSASRIYLALLPVFFLVYFSFYKSMAFFVLGIGLFIGIGYLHYLGLLTLPSGYEPEMYARRFYPWLNHAFHISILGMVVLYITRRFFTAFSQAIENLRDRNKLLSESERNYREIFNSTHEAIFIHDSGSSNIVDVNDAALRMYGFTDKEEIINSPVSAMSAENDPHIDERAKAAIRKAITEGPQVFEWKGKRKNGEVFYVEISLKSTNIGGEGRVLAVLRDVTERKQAEMALRISEEKLSTIFRLTPVAVAIADLENEYRITDVNEAFIRITGYKPDELIGYTHQEKMLWAYDHEYEEAAAIFREKGSLYDFGFHFKHKDGKIRNGRISVEPVIIAGRKSLVTVTVDTTLQKEAEKDLIAAREASELKGANLKAIIENTTDSIWAFDRNYKIIYINKVFRENFFHAFGVQLSPGVNLLESLPAAIQPMWKDRYDQALANQRIVFEDSVPTENAITYIQVAMNPILSDGNVIGVSCFGSDITERKQSEEAVRQSEEKFRIIFERSPLGIFRFNQMGIIYECNDSLTRVTGSPREKLIGQNLFEHPDEEFQETLKLVKAGIPAVFEGPYKNLFSGKTTPVRFYCTPVMNNDGQADGGICLAEDLTSHQQREEYRKQAEVASESAKFKQSFLANMSHEIRTPLTGVLGMIEMMENTKLSTVQQEYLNTLRLSGENLQEIINQVLDYSKIEAGKVSLKMSVFEVKSLLSSAENLYRNMAKKKVKFCTYIHKDLPGYIKADKGRISQVINNLLSNALKFTEKGFISLHAIPEGMDLHNHELVIRIEVEDTGIGIPESMQKYLFNPFSQVERDDAGFREGTGLGLSICKELVTLHGGEIGFKSHPHKGSLFWFTFKAAIPSDDEIHEIVSLKKPEAKDRLRILLVEDKKINQIVIRLLLNSLGHEVTLADDGVMALELFRPGLFDLILMDIQMPRMDGISATHALKEKHSKLPPIVGLSANAFEGDREKYMSQGLDEYLTKPVKQEDFIRMTGKLFK
jgi:PAS domain S-box-containing protein